MRHPGPTVLALALAVGDESLVTRYRARRIIDLGGRMAMPGFRGTPSLSP